MTLATPTTELDPRFSGPDATARPWADAVAQLGSAQTYWLTTVRPDGRPHVTPLIAVWHEGAIYFSTGETERKARNLADNTHCILTTGCNGFAGLDVVVEGEAVRVRDEALLQRIADAYVAKYGEAWRFEVRDGAFFHSHNAGGVALVFAVAPVTAFGFGKDEPFSQTRWRF
jgi:hypothetical protein